eukprot:TRINITY_DN9177_c0_g1_i1.p1 TRINITY_DN9177_c0_g1~~TRINITY_DN9177_c0_g1_i1.p1  ORF type:complete len:1346 (+),score=269.57 TRINITY_DN9177_c0_g1_i1:92-4129(+)
MLRDDTWPEVTRAFSKFGDRALANFEDYLQRKELRGRADLRGMFDADIYEMLKDWIEQTGQRSDCWIRAPCAKALCEWAGARRANITEDSATRTATGTTSQCPIAERRRNVVVSDIRRPSDGSTLGVGSAAGSPGPRVRMATPPPTAHREVLLSPQPGGGPNEFPRACSSMTPDCHAGAAAVSRKLSDAPSGSECVFGDIYGGTSEALSCPGGTWTGQTCPTTESSCSSPWYDHHSMCSGPEMLKLPRGPSVSTQGDGGVTQKQPVFLTLAKPVHDYESTADWKPLFQGRVPGPLKEVIVRVHWCDQGWENYKGRMQLYFPTLHEAIHFRFKGGAEGGLCAPRSARARPMRGLQPPPKEYRPPPCHGRFGASEHGVLRRINAKTPYEIQYSVGGGGGHRLHIFQCEVELIPAEEPHTEGAAYYQTQLEMLPLPPDQRVRLDSLTQVCSNKTCEGGLAEEDIVGKGSFGLVYKCRMKAVGGQLVACKTLPYKPDQDLKVLLRTRLKFVKEIRALLSIRHESLLTCYGWAEIHQNLIMVTEFCPGGELKQRLDKMAADGSLTPAKRAAVAFGVGRAIGAALTWMHSGDIGSSKLVHLDVAARNVLIATQPTPAGAILRPESTSTYRLADVGLLSPEGTAVPTISPPWSPPEVIRKHPSERVATLPHDVWAFGCLLYEVLRGVPFGEEREPLIQAGKQWLPEVQRRLMSFDLPVPPAKDVLAHEPCKKIWDLVFDRCWMRDPYDRPYMHEICQDMRGLFEEMQDQIIEPESPPSGITHGVNFPDLAVEPKVMNDLPKDLREEVLRDNIQKLMALPQQAIVEGAPEGTLSRLDPRFLAGASEETRQDALRIEQEQEGVAIWEWEDGQPGSGLWTRFEQKHAAALEAQFQAQQTRALLEIGDVPYMYNLQPVQAMKQVNMKTDFERAVRRRKPGAPAPQEEGLGGRQTTRDLLAEMLTGRARRGSGVNPEAWLSELAAALDRAKQGETAEETDDDAPASGRHGGTAPADAADRPYIDSLGPVLLRKDGQEVNTTEALNGKTVALYFGGKWCPHCPPYSKLLKPFYTAYKKLNPDFEVVFVSSDRSQREAEAYFRGQHGDWLMMPYSDSRNQALSQRFGASGIPTLVVLAPDGSVITTNGRKQTSKGAEGARAVHEGGGWHGRPAVDPEFFTALPPKEQEHLLSDNWSRLCVYPEPQRNADIDAESVLHPGFLRRLSPEVRKEVLAYESRKVLRKGNMVRLSKDGEKHDRMRDWLPPGAVAKVVGIDSDGDPKIQYKGRTVAVSRKLVQRTEDHQDPAADASGAQEEPRSDSAADRLAITDEDAQLQLAIAASLGEANKHSPLPADGAPGQ